MKRRGSVGASSLLLVAGATLAAASRANVLVVDAAGGGAFTQLPAALAAAADGDVLLVRAGTYSAYTGQAAPAKSLTLVADSSTSQPVLWDFQFHDQPAGHTVVVRGFELTTDFGYAVELGNCAGALVFEDCALVAAPIPVAGMPGWPGVQVSGCVSVTFVRSTLTGGTGIHDHIGGSTSSWGPGDGGTAADISTSHVAFHGCTLLGGPGGTGSYGNGANGGRGLSLISSTALFAGSVAQGGAGGNGCSNAELPQDCNGGPGIVLDSGSVLQVLEGSWTGGVPGVAASGQSGFVGASFVGPATQPVVFSGVARSLAVSSPVREQQPGVLALDGVAGDAVFFIASFQAGSLPVPGKKGWLALASPLLGPFSLGPIVDPSGQQTLAFTAPELVPSTLEGQTFLLQGVFVAATGGITLGDVTSFTLVDSAF